MTKAQLKMIIIVMLAMVLSNLSVVYILTSKIEKVTLQVCQDKLYNHIRTLSVPFDKETEENKDVIVLEYAETGKE